MSFGAYTRLFFFLLGGGLAALGISAALAFWSSQPRKEEEKIFATFAMAAVGCAFLVNCACGLQHKKMRAKGGTMSFDESGKAFYMAFIPLNLAIAILAIAAAVRIWCGIVPIKL